MAKKVVWTKQAREQRDSVLKYWLEKNNSNSYPIKLEELISQITSNLSVYPHLGKRTNFPEVRVVTLKDYQLFYRVGNHIQIIVFWDTRQNPDEFEI